MSYVIACSKIWDKNLIEKLKSEISEEFYLVTERDQLNLSFLREVKAKKVFFPHWSYIIKPEIFTEFECVIFHMTDLPYGRGGSPLQNLIVRDYTNTKISALKCASGLDVGPIYFKRDLSLEGTAQEIFIRATKIVGDMIVEIIKTNPEPAEQSGDVVLFERRKPEDSNLDKITDLKKIYNHIRMLDADGYPKAYLENEGVRYEFHSAKWNGEELEVKTRIIKK